MFKKIFLAIIFFMLVVGSAFAGENPFQYPLFQAINADGDPVSGGLVYTYEPGTTTPKIAYRDSDFSIPASNPIILDSKGEYLFYLNGYYKIDVKTSAGVQVDGFPIDNVSTMNDLQSFPNIATLKGISYTPRDGQIVNVLGYYAEGDGGGGQVYWDATSTELANNVTVFILDNITHPAPGRFKKSDTGIYRLKEAGLKLDGVTDDSTALQNLFDVIDLEDAVIDTQSGDCLIDDQVILESNKRFKFIGNVNFIMGPSFADGQVNANEFIMIFRGFTPRTATATSLFYNYFKEASVPALRKGTRILISDTDATRWWDVGGNNYRNSLQTFVDYADTASNVINFYPEINFPVTILGAVTKEIDPADMQILIYEDDITVHIDQGIKYSGSLNPLAVSNTRAYAKGILVKRGRFVINADFDQVSDGVRIEEAICSYKGIMQGGDSQLGGNGIKAIQGSTLYVSDSTITGYRHGVAIGGSTQDGASGYLSNCKLGDARQSYNANTYPQNESRGLDCHGNSQIVQAVNCDIRGVQTGGGVMSVTKSKIASQTNPPIEIRGQEPKDGGELYISDCDVILPPYWPSNQDVLGGGIGQFQGSLYFMYNSIPVSVASGWKIEFSNTRFKVADVSEYPAGTVLHLEPGNVDFSSFRLKNGCSFRFGGTNIREIAIDPRVVNGDIDLGDTEFSGCSPTVAIRNPTISDQWQTLNIGNIKVANTDTVTGSSYSHGLQIGGRTTISSNNRKIFINGARIETVGTTGGITIAACVSEGVTIINSDVLFTSLTGTLGYGIRSSRNQDIVTKDHFILNIDNNTVNNAALTSGNSITVGIQVLGLDLNGGSGLPAGFYKTGNNAIKGATTPITFTGTALTGV